MVDHLFMGFIIFENGFDLADIFGYGKYSSFYDNSESRSVKRATSDLSL